MHFTTQYATDIVYGGMIANRYEYLACKRHLDDLARSVDDPAWPYVFDETRANRLSDFFLKCRHVRGCFAGQPIELLGAWAFDLGCVFGWVDRVTGARRFTTAYIRVARGNCKSTVMSGVANYGMVADACYPPGRVDLAKYEHKPEVVCLAVDKGQADIVWGDARDMALASPDIARRLNVQKTRISHRSRGGDLRKLSKETKNKDGGAPCIIVVDEYHDHTTSNVKDRTAYGKGKRTQSLEIIITTAGEDADRKPCKLEDDTVKKILDKEMDADTYYGVIREIDNDDDPHNEKTWVKANPIFRKMDEYSMSILAEMKSEHDIAYGSGDNSKIRQWLIKRVNRWQYDAENRYFSGCLDKWKALAVPRDVFCQMIKGRDAYGGLDLSQGIDLTADAVVVPLDDKRYAVMARGYMPEAAVTRHEHTDVVPYRDWARDGWLTITEGDVTDYEYIKTHFQDLEMDLGLQYREICFDPYNATHFIQNLQSAGLQTWKVRQGVQTLSAPTKFLRELTLQGRIVHDGSPLLTWCLSNAIEETDNNGNIKLSKKMRNSTQRIDLAAAAINAFVRAMITETQSIYNERGMLSL